MYPSTRSVFPATDVCMAIHTFCGFPHDNGALRFLHAPPRIANCGHTPMYVWPYIRSMAFHTITVPSASSMTPRESPTAATPRCMHGHTYVPWLSTR